MTTVAKFKETGGSAIAQIEINQRHAPELAKQPQSTRSFILAI